MGSRLAPHFQMGLPHWAENFFLSSGAQWGKIMDHGWDAPLPNLKGVTWIARFYEDESVAREEVMRGAGGALRRYKRLESLINDRPWLKDAYLEHMNEPSNAGILSTKNGRLALDEFTAEYTRILHNEKGIRSVGYCLGVGHPEPEHVEQIFSNGLQALSDFDGMWSLHEYGWPSVMNGIGYYCLRYRQTVAALRNAGIVVPKLAITECGLDKLLYGEIGGWKLINNSPLWYVRQELAMYDSYLQEDDYVECATAFTSSAEQTWWSYEITEADSEPLADYIRESW